MKNKNKNILRTIWSQRVSWFMMAPFLLIFSFITLIPAIVSIVLSFCNYNLFQEPTFVGLDNFVNLFMNDSIFIKSLSNTLIYAVTVGLFGYLLSFGVAWIINDLPNYLRTITTFIFYIPSIAGSAVSVFSILFSSDSNGYVNAWLIKIGIIDEPILWFQDPDLALIMVIIVQIWMSLGVGFLAFIAGLKNIDKSLYESAAIDGIKNRFQELWYITLPSMKSMLMFGAVTQIATAFGGGEIANVLCGSPSVDYAAHTLTLHAADYSSVRLEMGYAATISFVLFLMILITHKFVSLLLSRVGK